MAGDLAAVGAMAAQNALGGDAVAASDDLARGLDADDDRELAGLAIDPVKAVGDLPQRTLSNQPWDKMPLCDRGAGGSAPIRRAAGHGGVQVVDQAARNIYGGA